MILVEGIKKKNLDTDSFEFNFDQDDQDDVISLTSADLHLTSLGNNIYCYGYSMNDVSHKVRDEFMHWLKYLPSQEYKSQGIHNFIANAVNWFNREFDINDFSCILYPDIQRNKLVNDILICFGNLLNSGKSLTSFSVAKNSPYRNYLNIKDEKGKKFLSNLVDTDKVLIIDDNGSTGSTLREVIRAVRSINKLCRIYLFTLIGKDYI